MAQAAAPAWKGTERHWSGYTYISVNGIALVYRTIFSPFIRLPVIGSSSRLVTSHPNCPPSPYSMPLPGQLVISQLAQVNGYTRRHCSWPSSATPVRVCLCLSALIALAASGCLRPLLCLRPLRAHSFRERQCGRVQAANSIWFKVLSPFLPIACDRLFPQTCHLPPQPPSRPLQYTVAWSTC